MDLGQSTSRNSASRRYMSKSQRACDFCRLRKNACIIEKDLPCRLCKLHGRDCTFNNSVRQLRRIQSSRARTSAFIEDQPQQINQSSTKNRSGGSDVSETPQITQHAGEIQLDSFGDDVSVEAAVQFQPQYEPSDGFLLDAFAAQEDIFLPLQLDFLSDTHYVPDQFMQENPELSPATAEGLHVASPNTSAQHLRSSAMSRIVEECALTGDMDPYLMRHHVYDSSHTFISKRLAIHSISDGQHPIHFLSFPKSVQEDSSHRLELESIVNPEIGKRLIDL